MSNVNNRCRKNKKDILESQKKKDIGLILPGERLPGHVLRLLAHSPQRSLGCGPSLGGCAARRGASRRGCAVGPNRAVVRYKECQPHQ